MWGEKHEYKAILESCSCPGWGRNQKIFPQGCLCKLANEHFTVDEYIIANCEYPGEWDGIIERTERVNELIITVTQIYPRDKSISFHVTSFIQTKDDKIIAMDEYYADDGSAPQWRLDKHIGTSVK